MVCRPSHISPNASRASCAMHRPTIAPDRRAGRSSQDLGESWEGTRRCSGRNLRNRGVGSRGGKVSVLIPACEGPGPGFWGWPGGSPEKIGSKAYQSAGREGRGSSAERARERGLWVRRGARSGHQLRHLSKVFREGARCHRKCHREKGALVNARQCIISGACASDSHTPPPSIDRVPRKLMLTPRVFISSPLPSLVAVVPRPTVAVHHSHSCGSDVSSSNPRFLLLPIYSSRQIMVSAIG